MDINSSRTASQAMPIGQTSRSTSVAAVPREARVNPASAAQPVAALNQDAQLEDAVKAVNDMLALAPNAIAFSIDDESGKTIVKLVDNETNEVIRQFPSKQMLAIAKDMTQYKGLLISEKS